ncbi:MAG: DUF4430 domain-containing protein [Gaiellaceae bacterium]
MLRRTLAVLASLAVALMVVPFAAAALVHIRVEGKTVTIFGPSQPKVEAANPLAALQSAAQAGEFYVHVTASSFGNYVDQIGFYPGAGNTGWVFKVNGVSPPVGADQVVLKDGDVVEWYYATFGANGGPPTLALTKTSARCYRATGQDDQGVTKVPSGLVYHAGGRTIPAPAGHICFAKAHGLVWATAPGAVRSNRLP